MCYVNVSKRTKLGVEKYIYIQEKAYTTVVTGTERGVDPTGAAVVCVE
jgi:hypothetical protein